MSLNREELASILRETFKPQRLEVIDDSAEHVGHSGHSGSGASHFRVFVVSSVFKGKPLLERHRMIYRLLEAHMGQAVHALAITAKDPDEAADA